MKTVARFYHAGCPVCVSAEQNVAESLDPNRFDLEIIHIGEDRSRVGEAESLGISSVPALVIGNDVYHINFGASIADLK
ncbi:MAG: thioredoxin family protein [Ignavibacteriae bacterium]|nr:thioredoxin family protein [Ignavibacteriota bacterium]MCB9215806.1 thioredoxin family protein [Ignavibacteria bacterium]